MKQKRIFSGVQPSGTLHIGNYLGAVRHWVQRQNNGDNIFCIVDLHAITIARNPQELREYIYELAILFFACGIDPKRSSVFIQSHIKEHAELAWLLTCNTPMGWLKRMTQFKDKAGKKQDQVGAGLFTYPTLMAADILLYQTDEVPVGEDQKQHVELTRDIAESFNSKYGSVFTIPNPVIPSSGARIMGLDDPKVKMSKTTQFPNRYISMLDEPKVIRKKIARATTDSSPEIVFNNEMGDGVQNLLTIYQLFSEDTKENIRQRFEGKQYGELKKALGDLVVDKLTPIQKKVSDLKNNMDYVESLLAEGANRIRPLAEDTVSNVKKVMGLG